MALEDKYGRVTLEHGDIGEFEPVVVFRAKDELLPKVLAYYSYLCEIAGSPKHHLELVEKSMNRIIQWQKENGSRIPQSNSIKNRNE